MRRISLWAPLALVVVLALFPVLFPAELNYLGLGLANLINLFVPDRIVLGGSVMKSVSLDDLRKVITQGCRFVPFEKTELALASLGDDANLIGAARVWHHRFGQRNQEAA